MNRPNTITTFYLIGDIELRLGEHDFHSLEHMSLMTGDTPSWFRAPYNEAPPDKIVGMVVTVRQYLGSAAKDIDETVVLASDLDWVPLFAS
jgi:hypothetical protein